MSAVGLLDVGPMEMLVLGVAAIMLFGGDLPDIARRAGGIVGRLRAAAHELTKQIDPPPDLLHLPDPDAEARRAQQTPPQSLTPTTLAPPAHPPATSTPPDDAPPSPS